MRLLPLLTFVLLPASLAADDWNQWRGPHRSGYQPHSPSLLNQLPESGLRPLWQTEKLHDGSGGWSSPVVVGNRVYLYANPRTRSNVKLPPAKYPKLTKEQEAEKTEEERRAYMEKYRAEMLERRAAENRFDEYLFCLDASTGNVVWKNSRVTPATNRPQSGTPAVIDNRVYFLGAGRTARCVDALSGKNLWETKLPVKKEMQQIPSSVLVSHGVALYLAGSLVAIDTQSGRILWKSDEKTQGLYASAVVWEGASRPVAITNLRGRETVALELKTGKRLWSIETRAERSSPTIVGDRLLVYSNNRSAGLQCFALSEVEPEELWQFRGLADQGSSPVVVGDGVYVQGEKRLACISLDTGKPRWRTSLDLPRPRYTSLVAADNKVFYGYQGLLCFQASTEGFQPLYNARLNGKGTLATIDQFRKMLNMEELESTAEGQAQAERLWQREIVRNAPLDCASPAIANGRIYLRTRAGLVCYDLRHR